MFTFHIRTTVMGRIKHDAIASEDRRQPAVTLGDLVQRAADVFCWCNRCGHSAVIETARLIPELGPELAVAELGVHMVCSSCGSKDIAARPSWPGIAAQHRNY
jgi:hypothetical protein